jgi:pimeloyl-ACP methyl ester carboxylesterase
MGPSCAGPDHSQGFQGHLYREHTGGSVGACRGGGIPQAMVEGLRWISPIFSATTRTAARNTEFNGAWISAGQTIWLSYGSARVVQNPTVSLEDDVAVTRRAIAGCEGPVVLVGHSYGGAVITEAGTDEKVTALVYIAGFVPDAGESVGTLIADPPPGAPVPPILPPQDGFLVLDREKFASSFAADVPPGQAAFMADSQVPWGVGALEGAITKPAWRVLPSWYLLTTDDRMIPPAAQRAMSERAGSSVTEVAASHSVYVSQPQAVASLIKEAAGRQTP